MNMRVLLTGQGEREKHLFALCESAGHTMPGHGPWDLAVLPLPRSEISEEIAGQLPRGQKIVCGMTDEAFDRMARRRGWRLIRALEDESFTQENAELTAEGAVCAAMREKQDALCRCACLVIGYGRIGKALTRMLRGLGAQVTVAARRKESREEAGAPGIPIEDIPRVLPQTDVVFSTVPARILGMNELRSASKNTLLVELASAPYGIDPEAAKALHLPYLLESGVPGRYCPRSAARALMNLMEREGKA